MDGKRLKEQIEKYEAKRIVTRTSTNSIYKRLSAGSLLWIDATHSQIMAFTSSGSSSCGQWPGISTTLFSSNRRKLQHHFTSARGGCLSWGGGGVGDRQPGKGKGKEAAKFQDKVFSYQHPIP